MKNALTLFIALALASQAWAYDFEAEGLYFNITGDNTAEVTYPKYNGKNEYYVGYTKPTGSLSIPAKVTNSSTSVEYDVTSIGSSAFYNCSGLTSVTIPNSVTSIGSSAFYYCSGLTSVTIPNSVTSIGSSAFYGCSGLTSVTIGNSVTSIGERAFYGCSGLTSVTIPNSVTSIGSSAFYGCSGLTKAEFSSIESLCAIEFGNYEANPLYIAHHLYITGDENEVTDLVIPDNVTSIGSYTFYRCCDLKSVSIGNSVASIGYSAFYGCSGLSSVTIPNSVTSIGSSAFYLVKNVIYSGSAKGSPWGACAVNGFVEGGFVYTDNTKTQLAAYVGEDTEVLIHDGVTSIGSYAFYNCSGLTTVTIPNSVKTIGNRAFNGCSGLTSVTIPNSVTSIGSSAFYGCSGLTSVTIGNSVTSIGSSAFFDCSGLTSVTIPNSVTSIGDDAFRGCSGLTKAEFSSIESLCAIEFGNYEANPLYIAHHLYITGDENEVTDLVIPDNVTSIGSYAFEGCSGLTSVTIPNSVTSIGGYAFSGCSGMTSVTIGNSVTSIGSSAFYGCNGLKKADFASIENLCAIKFGNYSANPLNYAHHLYITGEENEITDLVIPDDVSSIAYCAFYGCSGLISVTIGNSVTSIGRDAFYGCSGVTSVTIGNSVTSIGDAAFYGCSSLTSVTIPNSVISIELRAFYDCQNLKFITIPSTIKKIETGFATLKKTTLYLESNNPNSIFSPTSQYSYAKSSLKALYTGCRVIRAGADDDKEGQVTIDGTNYAVVADDGSVWYTKKGSATLTATAKEGYHFVRWDDDDANATDNPRNVTVTQSRTYTAVFEADEPTALAAHDTQEMKVATAHGAIVITNATSEVWVYDIAGQCIAHELPAQKITISPNKKGLFVVKSPSARVRVIVY